MACDGGGLPDSGGIERSTNGGKSWNKAVKAALGPIVQLGFQPKGNLYTVGGAGEDCSIRYIAYSAKGRIAGQTDQPQGVWSRHPKDLDQIQGPGWTRARPCKGQHVLGLASVDTSEALVLCTRGSVMVTANSGKSWKKADELVGTMAVGEGGGHYWVAGVDKTCDGISVRSITFTKGDLSRGQIRCVAALPVTPGRIAIDGSDKSIWLWVGDEIRISTDRGKTWQAR